MYRRTMLFAALMVAATASMAQAPPTASASSGAQVRHGALSIEQAWMRQPPDGARVAGGYLRITNTGTTADRLVSGTTAFAGRIELHEMAMIQGVMKMRELSAGIEIKPGQTVELKPGGLHLMFMDLKEQPKAGEIRKTTLVFEKAGPLVLDLTVIPLSMAPAKKGHGHH